jgi:hypothetical protein
MLLIDKQPEDLIHLDLSEWDYQHIMGFFEMLDQTKPCNEPEASPVKIFSSL